MIDIEGDANPADMLTKYLKKTVWFPYGYASRLYNTDLSKISVSAAGASVPQAPGDGRVR